MKQSLSYYLTLLVIKLKGIKRDFSTDSIDFLKIRKEDIHHPKARLFKDNQLRTFKVADSLITELQPKVPANKLLLFIHGGAFISGPAQHHWDSIKKIMKHTKHTVWMCDYPKAPEHKIQEISANIDEVYNQALASYPAHHITLIGDSVGGTLIAALTQRLIQKSIALPHQIILVSPVMDATMSNPQIAKLDKTDPMLSKAGVLSAKKMCAGNDLKNPMISPIYGSFQGFPTTILFLAKNDITYPDQVRTVEKLRSAKAPIDLIEGENMPHLWPFLPVMTEAKTALQDIIRCLNKA